MSYRCAICDAKVKPGEPLRRHIIRRAVPVVRTKWIAGKVYNVSASDQPPVRYEIAAELPVCEACHAKLTVPPSPAPSPPRKQPCNN